MNGKKPKMDGPVCMSFPPLVNSGGILGQSEKVKKLYNYSLPSLEMQMIAIFALTYLINLPLKYLGFPKIVAEIAAGIILGSTVLGRIDGYQVRLFPFEFQHILSIFSMLGYALFLFIITAKMDMSIIKTTGSKGVVIGLLAVITPVIASLIFVNVMDRMDRHVAEFVVIAFANSLTPFPVIACLLRDLKILNSELGRLAMSSSMIGDLFSSTLISISVLFHTGKTYGTQRALVNMVLVLCFLIFVVLVVRPAMYWIIKQTPEGKPVKDGYLYMIVLCVLVSSIFTHWIEQSSLLGPFIIGLAVPAGQPLGSALVNKFDTFVNEVLMPIFMSVCCLRTNLKSIRSTDSLGIMIVALVSFVAKVAGCLLPALYNAMPFKDALALALILSVKGSVDIASFSFFRDNKVLTRDNFSAMVVVILVTAVIVQFSVKWLYDPSTSRKYAGYQKRNLMHSKQDAKLQMLVCIHTQDNITAVMKLLDTSNPSRETPIALNVLHLIELQGSANSLFISHQVQKRTISNRSYSESVILAFSKYERENREGVMVHAFTTVSPRKLMDEDICTLALDTLSSILIIPFHRKWAVDGSIESEDHSLRTLNCSVLSKSPCSVALLVDRGHFGVSSSSQSSFCVAMIFLGGNDDMEALTYAKRMAMNSRISLTVVRLISNGGDESSYKNGKMVDLEAMNNAMISKDGLGNAKCIEEVVKDGPETALIVRSMMTEYDLIIVGRRANLKSPQTSGLEQWSEFPELGVLGDLLASADLKSRASVLVVQQQMTH